MDKKNNASRKAARIARQRKQRNRRIALTVCLLLAVCMVTVGGTLAWLTASTEEVKNTFTTAGIDIELIETMNPDGTKKEDESAVTDWSAPMIPGYTYSKNPTVTVKANSVDCYLFVEFKENSNPSTYLTYTSTLTAEKGWTQGDGTDIPADVWYRKVKTSDTTRSWELLSGNTISVKDMVTKDNMQNAASATLIYTAYASQLYKSAGVEFSAKEAWANVPKT